MKVFCVFQIEPHVGEFLMKIFDSKEKAQAYVELVKIVDHRDFEIEELEVE